MKTKTTSPITAFFKPRVDKPRNGKGHSVLTLKVTPITKYFAVQPRVKPERRLKENSEFLADDLVRKPLKTTLNTPTKKPLQVHKPKRLSSRTFDTDDLFCRNPIKQSHTIRNHSFAGNLQQSMPRKEEKADSLDVNSPSNLSPSVMSMLKGESMTHYKQEPSGVPPAASYLRADSIIISDSPLQPDPVHMVDLTVDTALLEKVCPMAIDLTDSPALSVPVEGVSSCGGVQAERSEKAFQSLFREADTWDAEMSSCKEKQSSEIGPFFAATASTVAEMQPRPSPAKEPLPAKTPGHIVSELVSFSDSTVSTTMAALSLQTPVKPQRGFIKPPNVPSPHNQPTEAQITAPSSRPLMSPSATLPSCQVPPTSFKTELELLLWQRGVPYTLQPGQSQSRVLLFNKTQNCIAENLAESGLRASSRKLCGLVAYLHRSTSSLIMPRSSSLQSLWEMVVDTHTVSNHVSWESLMELIGYLRTLLSVHPPGQHPIVDQQYATFVASLGPGGPFSAWEDMHNLLRGPQYCTHLFAYIVDLLLSDYWTSLASLDGDQRRPLFVGLFWEQLENVHITMPLRQLIDLTLRMVADLNRNLEVEVSKLESCMALLFLAATHCQDLEMELTIACRGLQPEQQSLFLSYVRPTPLRAAIIRTYSPLEQRLSLSTQTDGVLTPHVSSSLPPSMDVTSSPLQVTGVSAALPMMCGSDTDSTQVLNICTANNSTQTSMPPQTTTGPVVTYPPSSVITHSTTQLQTSTSRQAIESKPKSALVSAAPAPAVRNIPATTNAGTSTSSVVPYKRASAIAMNRSTHLRYKLAAPYHTTTKCFAGNVKRTGCKKCSGGTCVHCRPKRALV